MTNERKDIKTEIAEAILKSWFYDGEESFYDGLDGFYRDCDPDHWFDAEAAAGAVIERLRERGALSLDALTELATED